MSIESPPREQQQPDQPPPQPPPPPPPPPPPLDQRRRAKPPTKVLVSRSYTIAVLLISLVILYALKNTDKENKGEVIGAPLPSPPKKGSPEKYQPPPGITQPSFKISELGSLRSVLTVAVIGIGCNLYQLGMLIHWMVTGKDLAQNKYNIFFNYYCDKAVALLLAASVGAGIGSMLDIKQVHPSFQYVKSFFSVGQISTTLLATAMISTSVSSTSSSEAMQEYKRTLEKGEKAVGMLGPLGTWANKAYHCCCACC